MANEKRLIDANALLEKAHWIIRSDGTRVFAIHAEDVDDAPTVDAVQVVHGRWIEYRCLLIKENICSNCKEFYRQAHNYCPNCGAKMDGDGNG